MSFDAEPDTTSNGNKGNNGRGKGKGQSSTSSVTQSGVITLYSHYDGRQEQGQWQQAGHGFEVFRSLTLLPQANLPYAQVLHQSLSDNKSQLVKASGTKGADATNLYVHHDRLGSAIQVLDDTGTQAMRLGYSPFGQVYRKHNDKTQWKINAGVNANKQLGQLMPYQYTGGYTDGNTGLVHLDARWYNPHTSRFVQPDYWNLKNTYLPTEIRHELMRFTGLNASQLLRDPSQQLAFGYVSGNPLSWVDPFGLAAFELVVEGKVGAGVHYKEGYGIYATFGEETDIGFLKQTSVSASTEISTSLQTTGTFRPSVSSSDDLSGESYSGGLVVNTPLFSGSISTDINGNTAISGSFGPSLGVEPPVHTEVSRTVTEIVTIDSLIHKFNRNFEKVFLKGAKACQ